MFTPFLVFYTFCFPVMGSRTARTAAWQAHSSTAAVKCS